MIQSNLQLRLTASAGVSPQDRTSSSGLDQLRNSFGTAVMQKKESRQPRTKLLRTAMASTRVVVLRLLWPFEGVWTAESPRSAESLYSDSSRSISFPLCVAISLRRQNVGHVQAN